VSSRRRVPLRLEICGALLGVGVTVRRVCTSWRMGACDPNAGGAMVAPSVQWRKHSPAFGAYGRSEGCTGPASRRWWAKGKRLFSILAPRRGTSRGIWRRNGTVWLRRHSPSSKLWRAARGSDALDRWGVPPDEPRPFWQRRWMTRWEHLCDWVFLALALCRFTRA